MKETMLRFVAGVTLIGILCQPVCGYRCEITEFDRDGLHCHHMGAEEIHNRTGEPITVIQHFIVRWCCDSYQ